jgi:hypothetical protein
LHNIQSMEKSELVGAWTLFDRPMLAGCNLARASWRFL